MLVAIRILLLKYFYEALFLMRCCSHLVVYPSMMTGHIVTITSALVKTLQKKQEDGESAITRYNLCDNVYGKAEIDTSVGIVNLWLGANVMLEYTYQEAIEFLQTNLSNAQKESKLVQEDLAFVRDQIVTSEVSMSRIFNWDVRRKRAAAAVNEAKPPTAESTTTMPPTTI